METFAAMRCLVPALISDNPTTVKIKLRGTALESTVLAIIGDSIGLVVDWDPKRRGKSMSFIPWQRVKEIQLVN